MLDIKIKHGIFMQIYTEIGIKFKIVIDSWSLKNKTKKNLIKQKQKTVEKKNGWKKSIKFDMWYFYEEKNWEEKKQK